MFTDCSEGFKSGYYTNEKKVFKIHPPTAPAPFSVWCDMEWGGKTFVMQRTADAPFVDFDRTWEEYKNGFGDMDEGKNFWLGNENLHYVTNHRAMTLIIHVLHDQGIPPVWNYRQRMYATFQVGI